MRILHIIWSAGFGGIEKLVIDLSTEQNSSNIDCGILIGSKEEGAFLQKFKDSKIPCCFLELANGYDFSIKKMVKAYKIFCKYDVLHFHSFNPAITICGILSKKKILYTMHSIPGRRENKKTDIFIDLCKKIFWKYFVNYITFNSYFTQKKIRKYYNLNKTESMVVYNGIDISTTVNKSDLPYKELNLSNKNFIIGTSSRFAKFKRIDRLIKSFSIFLKDHKLSILLIVGDGVLMETYKRIVNDLNLNNNVIFTGYKPNVQDYQNIMDICVFPSENEPFGLVAVETLLLGKPTLVFSDGGGLVEIIKGVSKNDVIDNISELTNRLKYYYNNKELLTAYAPKRIEHANKFSIKIMAESFNKIYYTLLNN